MNDIPTEGRRLLRARIFACLVLAAGLIAIIYSVLYFVGPARWIVPIVVLALCVAITWHANEDKDMDKWR